MSESQVHKDFVKEPMGEKPASALAGIGARRGESLKAESYGYAYQVLGQYLALNQDEKYFKRWLYVICSADTKQQQDCWMCLRDWCDNFLNTSTSEKHKKFVEELIDDKPVTAIAGIGHDLGEKLKAAGFVYAYHVLGQFLKNKKDPTCFKGWLRDTCVANDQEQNDCYSCLKDWCAAHLD